MNFLRAIPYPIVLWIFMLAIGAAAAQAGMQETRPIEYIAGTLMAIFVATRDHYEPDWQGWVLLFLGPLGWLVAFWRRFNALERRRQEIQAAR